MNYGRCRAKKISTTNKMLDASSLSLLCMTLVEFCDGGRDKPILTVGSENFRYARSQVSQAS